MLHAFVAQVIIPVVTRAFIDRLSSRVPLIVIVTLCAALIGAWTSAPVWVANGLAIVVGILALLLFASKGRREQFNTAEEQDVTRSRGWIAHELAGHGTPPGFYVLGFFGVVTIVLTDYQSAYAKLAWAGFILGVVWGIVNAHYPADEGSD